MYKRVLVVTFTYPQTLQGQATLALAYMLAGICFNSRFISRGTAQSWLFLRRGLLRCRSVNRPGTLMRLPKEGAFDMYTKILSHSSYTNAIPRRWWILGVRRAVVANFGGRQDIDRGGGHRQVCEVPRALPSQE